MRKNRVRFLLLAILLTGATLLSGVKPADACIREMCFEVDYDTTCCWSETCVLECWDW